MKIAWAVETVEDGKKLVFLDYSRHSTPDEAKQAIEEQTGIAWLEHEKKGARIVQRDIYILPPKEP